MLYNDIKHIIKHFDFEGTYESAEELVNGNVNFTYKLYYRQADGSVVHYVLQRINTIAFRDPESLMENIVNVVDHLVESMREDGINPERRVLRYIKCDKGTYLYEDRNGNYWRADVFIDGTTAYDKIDDGKKFYEAGKGFGEFQRYLFDFPAEKLTDTIPDFHNTKKRFYTFVAAVAADKAGRVKDLEKEIDFFFDRRKMMSEIVDEIKNGKIPLRVTHNDTKLNNVLMDDVTGEAVCVIDLDTVMPGSVLYDYGDAIRFGAATAPEDEKDVSKMHVDMELFKNFTDGFLSEVSSVLTNEEIHLLPLGVKVITCELAMRFLTDYIDGDEYFKIKYPDHNLVRARAQMKLLTEVESRFDEMTEYVDKFIANK